LRDDKGEEDEDGALRRSSAIVMSVTQPQQPQSSTMLEETLLILLTFKRASAVANDSMPLIRCSSDAAPVAVEVSAGWVG